MKTTKWMIDPAPVDSVKVKHMMITTVTGTFKEFNSEVVTDGDDFSTSRITFEAATESVFTNAEQRDAHLRSADFFDADNFPVMSFISSRLEKVDEDSWQLTGDLTIRGVAKTINLMWSLAVLAKTHGETQRPASASTAKSTVRTGDLTGMQHLRQEGFLSVTRFAFTPRYSTQSRPDKRPACRVQPHPLTPAIINLSWSVIASAFQAIESFADCPVDLAVIPDPVFSSCPEAEDAQAGEENRPDPGQKSDTVSVI